MTDERRPPRLELAIETTPGFEPSARLRAALDALDAALEAELAPFAGQRPAGSEDADDEVGAYALTIGDLGGGLSPSGAIWNDGCWGFGDGHCRWFQGKCSELVSCTMMNSGARR